MKQDLRAGGRHQYTSQYRLTAQAIGQGLTAMIPAGHGQTQVKGLGRRVGGGVACC
jgi:hypothetical protein